MRAATYSLLALMAIAACSADLVVVTKPLSAAAGAPAVLSAQLAMVGATLPLCQGTNDALPIVFSHPLAEEPTTESFTVTVGDETITPNCATLAPADEENERQTVLLLGQFQLTDTFQPMEVSIRDITLQVNGSTVPLVSEESFTVDLDGPSVKIASTRNQTLVDFSVLDLSQQGNTADDDANGCAALFPASTYAIRLIFSSGVRELNAGGALVPLGTDASPARANEFFELRTDTGEPAPDMIIGQADADGDNVADICVQGAGAARAASVVVVTCATDAAVISPDGTPCSTPIEVRLDEVSPSDPPTAGALPTAAPAPSDAMQEAGTDGSPAAASSLHSGYRVAVVVVLLACCCL